MRNKTKYLRSSKETFGLNDADIDSKYLEQVEPYQHLGSAVNGDNSTEKEITKRIALAIKFIMPIKKYLKANQYKRKPNQNYIGTVLTNASETWVLKESMKQNFIITE